MRGGRAPIRPAVGCREHRSRMPCRSYGRGWGMRRRARPGHGCVMPATSAIGLAQAGQGNFPKEQPDEVITVWWQYIAIPALLAAGIYGFVVLVRHMTQQVTRETSRRAEDMYDEFGSTRKEKDRWPI
jgi:hypothetical protein